MPHRHAAVIAGSVIALAVALQVALTHGGPIADALKARRLSDDPFIDILKESGITLGMHDMHGNLIVPTPAPTKPPWCTMTGSMYKRCMSAGGCCKRPSMCAFGCPKAQVHNYPHPVPTPYVGKHWFRSDGTMSGLPDNPAAAKAPQQQYRAPQQQYRAPQQQYRAPQQQYRAPQQQYRAPQQQQYRAPQQQQQYRAPQQQARGFQQYAAPPPAPSGGGGGSISALEAQIAALKASLGGR